MDINEMHNVFRTVGQQMGMEDMRIILPSSIDVLINSCISDKVNSVLSEHTNQVSKDRFSTRTSVQNAPVTPINALRTLYRIKDIDLSNMNITEGVRLGGNDILIYTSFAIKYKDDSNGYSGRLIEGDELEDTLNDYLNRASWRYPIVSMFSDENSAEYLKIFVNSKTHIPQTLEVKYIAVPNVVRWDTDVSKRVDCNLPEYLHQDIVTMAVNKFFASVSATSKQTN